MKQRNLSLDVARGIAIVAVVVGHSECPVLLRNFVYLFHLPLFFFISGYLFNPECIASPRIFFTKKLLRLWKPYVIYNLVFLSISPLLHWLGIMPDAMSISEVLRSALLAITFVKSIPLIPFWFLRSMFVCFVLLFGIYYLASKLKGEKLRRHFPLCAVAILYIIGVITSYHQIILPAGIQRELMLLGMLFAGVLFRQYEQQVVRLLSPLSMAIGLGLMVACSFWIEIDLVYSEICHPLLYSLILPIAILSIYQMAVMITRGTSRVKQMMECASRYSIEIYGLHLTVLISLDLWLAPYLADCWATEFLWVVKALLGTALPIIITKLIPSKSV